MKLNYRLYMSVYSTLPKSYYNDSVFISLRLNPNYSKCLMIPFESSTFPPFKCNPWFSKSNKTCSQAHSMLKMSRRLNFYRSEVQILNSSIGGVTKDWTRILIWKWRYNTHKLEITLKFITVTIKWLSDRLHSQVHRNWAKVSRSGLHFSLV